KGNDKEKIKDILLRNDIKPLLISHDFKLPLEGENKEILEIYELSKELDLPFLLINPCEKPSNISFNVALEMFAKNLSRSLSKIDLLIVIRINAFSVVNTLSKAYKVLNLIKERERLSLAFDTFHFYLGGEDFDVFRDKDFSQIKFVFLKDAENVPRYYLKENQQVFPGEGVIPLVQILTYLRDGGFNGYIVPEVVRPEYEKMKPEEYVSKLMETTRRIMSYL
ncbi:sugar phosphate isomerase/epimerase, partial [Dictyoglomus sp.]